MVSNPSYIYEHEWKQIHKYLDLPILAKISDDGYTQVIVKGAPQVKGPTRAGTEFVIEHKTDRIVFAGYWMDLPEKSWGLSKKSYYKLPEEERAMLELEEQRDVWGLNNNFVQHLKWSEVIE